MHDTPPPHPQRDPATIRREGNFLKPEKSLYLQQHAHNPLEWYPWTESALERAQAENKPIFLSIGYSSCHWCHVMEHDVFEHDDVAEFMNAHFVNVKLDREERPDLDAVYMAATLRFTNGHGGWPMSVFLTPTLKPFFAGTYFPKPHFMALTQRIAELWAAERDGIERDADAVADEIAQRYPVAPAAEILSLDELTQAAHAMRRHFDPRWGGVGNQKFPTPLRWQFLLHLYRKTDDATLRDMLRLTLDRMGDGGIHDHLGGGFHRYTVEPTWLVPHFEKMLYDNAQLAALYLEAGAVFADARYDEIATDTLDFMIREMSGGPDDPGGFYASYDADSDGVEGSFYVWTPEEIIEVIGSTDGEPLALLLGVRPGGNFEGKSILTRRMPIDEVAREFDRPSAEIAGLVATHRDALRTARAARVWPGLDKKIVTSWNGLAISAFALGFLRFGDDRYRAAAERAVDFLWNVHRRPDRALWRTSTDGVAANPAILDDYAFLATGLLDLFQATGSVKHLTWALELIEYAEAHFTAGNDGYFLTPDSTPAPLGRQIEIFDSVEPSGMSALLDALLKSAALTGNDGPRHRVESLVAAYGPMMQRAGLEMGMWYDVALKLHGPFYDAVIAGTVGGTDTAELLDVVRRRLPRYAVVTTIPKSGAEPALLQRLPTLTGKAAPTAATAYVCRFGQCDAPTTDPTEFARQLCAGWHH